MFKINKLVLIAATLLLSNQATAAYLGMRVQNLPAHVRAHLPDTIANNQGVIVDWLEDISPAADEGIKRYDVLLSYGDQPITSASAFMQKIAQQQSGKKANIKLLRQGKVQTLEITSGDHPKSEKMTKPAKQTYLYRPVASPQKRVSKTNNRFQQMRRALNIAGKPAFPMRQKPEVHAWGTERNIWPDFYTDGTSEIWDNMINAPFKMGRMPGGWRAPSLSMPDPVTIGDAVTNQMPPMAEEMGNMMDISD